MASPAAEAVLHYHRRTKHRLDRYARSPGFLDWDNQPDPFRRYDGCERTALPLAEEDPAGGPLDLYEGAATPRPLDRAAIGCFLELSLSLSAWKAAGGSRWALRIPPSSGNLHPTEGYLVLPPLDGLPAGLYHYQPFWHALELRAAAGDLLAAPTACGSRPAGFLFGLTSIFWREAWKYGERAFRYCLLDAGHALAAARFSAALLGWRLSLLTAPSDEQTAALLGIDRTAFAENEEEHPELLAWVATDPSLPPPAALPAAALDAVGRLRLAGVPNRLSADHVAWPEISRAAAACRKPETPPRPPFPQAARPWLPGPESPLSAARILRRRRSGLAFDPRRGLDRERFLVLLDRTLPRPGKAPFDALAAPAEVDLFLFVHRVAGLRPGLYLLVRGEGHEALLRGAMAARFRWEPVLEGFPLFLLEEGDVRGLARMVSCHQEIAGDGAFSLGMIARFEEVVRREPFRYRELFRECGMIGQVLYLEAEAHGFRGTGIGCFFDDEVHAAAGLEGLSFQSLYHFTVGAPIEDPRITTLPPYGHLDTR